jgi:adenosylcobinamide-phosphate synthase
MVGHRCHRYSRFGWAAARLDDLLTWPAARLGAVLACLLAPAVGGDPGQAWRTLQADGAAHPSPIAGPVEAALSLPISRTPRMHAGCKRAPTLTIAASR